MEQKALGEAVENISLIKEIIERTTKTFISFSKIFIYWGILFLILGGLQVVLRINKEKITATNWQIAMTFYVLMICVFLGLAALSYRNISKKVPLIGLEKPLMKVWQLIIIMNIVPIKFIVHNLSMGRGLEVSTIKQTSNFSVLLFSLAIGLILTSLLSDYKQPKVIGFVYIGLSVIYAFTNSIFFDDKVFPYIQLIALPFTLLYLGIYLKTKQIKEG